MADEKKPWERRLSPEEKALWDAAMRDVVKKERSKEITVTPAKSIIPVPSANISPTIYPALPASYAGERMLDKTLERRQAKKIRQGKITIDAKIDLHGFTEDKAYQNLCKRLDAAYHHGKRCVLVVTGKGKNGSGILARRVPEWLSSAEFKHKIIEIASALPEHGGSGAIYVFLKKH